MNSNKQEDSIQKRLTGYACALNYNALTHDAIHAAKVRVIDTLGALIGGFFGEPCRIARDLAVQFPDPYGATIIGTRAKTTLDMAAFVNSTTARFAEINDAYNWPGTTRGHPSDVLTPMLAVAEHAQLDGRSLIMGIVLAYEVYLRISHALHDHPGFDHTNCLVIGTAAGAGKLLDLSPQQYSHCISMAVVPNVSLRQQRRGHLSMFKTAASGQAARAGVFAAMLARAGMEGPHLPFEGKAGWCEHVAGQRFSLDTLGGDGTPFKILDTHIKQGPVSGTGVSTTLAAEKVAPLRNIGAVKEVTVEVYELANERLGSGDLPWNPQSQDDADHSIPYVVAATLMDGKVTLRSYNDAHLWNPELRALMQKIKVVENVQFSLAYKRQPPEHRSRVTVVMQSGERLAGESGGDDRADMSAQKNDEQIAKKFRELTEDSLGAKRVTSILDRLWHLEDMKQAAEILPAFDFG